MERIAALRVELTNAELIRDLDEIRRRAEGVLKAVRERADTPAIREPA